MKLKFFYEMSDAEIAEKKKPTEKELRAIENFLDAAKALPSRCYVSFDRYERGENNLSIGVRVSRGYGVGVKGISKKSLNF